MEEIRLIVATDPPPSPARTRPPAREPFRIAAVQQRWHPDRDEHEAALAAGITLAAREGARLICLQELTLSRYFAVDPAGPTAAGAEPEDLPGGPTYRFAARMAAATGAHIHASLYERAAAPGAAARPIPPTASATTPRSSSPLTASWPPARASSTSRSPPATTRTATSARARPLPTRSRSSPSATPASACRPAGTSGSPRSPAPTAWPGPR